MCNSLYCYRGILEGCTNTHFNLTSKGVFAKVLKEELI